MACFERDRLHRIKFVDEDRRMEYWKHLYKKRKQKQKQKTIPTI